MEPAALHPITPAFRQPKPLIRWLAVLLAVAGWLVSIRAMSLSAGAAASDPLINLLCGGSPDNDCHSVLISPPAFLPPWPAPTSPRIPVSALGLFYFAFIALWYLLIGPPAYRGRAWHLLLAAIVLVAAAQSAWYIHLMANVLHRWCGICLLAHGINAGILVLTALAWPWRRPAVEAMTQSAGETPALPGSRGRSEMPGFPHPTARLAVATVVAGILAATTQLAVVGIGLISAVVTARDAEYSKVLDDPDYIRWDFQRRPVKDIPLYPDEIFAGNPEATNTAVVFGDFSCTHCRQLHEVLVQTAKRHPDRLRVAFRYYPQDPECNPNPQYRSLSSAACRSARAAEAARLLGGRDAYLAFRARLWDRQAELTALAASPTAGKAAVSEWLEQRAAELNLNPADFLAAMDSAPIRERIQHDISLASRLGEDAMPVVYINGKRLRAWTKPETWDAILSPAPASAPATQP